MEKPTNLLQGVSLHSAVVRILLGGSGTKTPIKEKLYVYVWCLDPHTRNFTHPTRSPKFAQPPDQQEQHGTPLIDSVSTLSPETQACLRHGRPDLPAIIARMRGLVEIGGGGRAAVMVCGPASMVRQVEKLAAEHSGRGTWLDCHAETFDL